MEDAFTSYETDLKRLLERLGEDHPRYADARTLQSRLLENIDQARLYGDTETRRAERAQIVDALNCLALKAVDVGFDERGLAELPSPKEPPRIKLPLLVMLLFNSAIVITLACILGPPTSCPCISPQVSAPSRAVVLLLFFHLAWRYFNPVIRGLGDSVKVMGAVAFPIRGLTALFDALHPWILSDLLLWVWVMILSLAAGIVGPSPFSPFSITEPPPDIQAFLIHHDNGHTETYTTGGLVEIPAYTFTRVEARVSDQAHVLCTWSVVRGMQIPAGGCAIMYGPPIEGDRDALSVLAQSPYRSGQAFAGFHVKVMQAEP